MGVRKSIILFADIIGCSEVSNNCSIDDYEEFLKEFHTICVETRELLFPKDDYSVDKLESAIRGDEICLILHSGKDIKENISDNMDEEKGYLIKDIRNSLLFAFGLKLMWLASKYNQDRIKCSLLPRDLAIGINIGPLMFKVHPATVRENSSEGFAINLAKRIEGVSREGKYSKIFVCKEFKYLCNEYGIPIEFDTEQRFDLKGITTPPYLHEIKDITDRKIITESLIMKELQKLKPNLDLYYKTAIINEQEFCLKKLVLYILLASKDDRVINIIGIKEDEDNLIEKGFAYYSLGDLELSLECYQKVTKINPVNITAYYYIGLIDYKKFEYNKAIEVLQRILKIDSRNFDAMNSLGAVYRELCEYKKSIECLNDSLKIEPKNEYTLTLLGDTYRELGEYDKALECLNNALRIKPKSCILLRSFAIIYRVMGEYEKSLECLNTALKINPKDDYTIRSFGNSYNLIGEYEKSLEYLNKALKINSKDEYTLRMLGITYRLMGEFEKSLEYLNKGLKINARNDYMLGAFGITYGVMGEYKKSLEYLNKALEINPKNDYTLIDVGETYKDMNEYEKSLEYLNKALEINPKNDDILRALGDTYKEMGEFEKALEYLNQALKINPKNDRIYIVLGRTYGRKKEFETALNYIEKSAKINNKNPATTYAFACIYCLKHDKERTYEFLQETLKKTKMYKILANKEKDFESIRNEDDFKKLISP